MTRVAAIGEDGLVLQITDSTTSGYKVRIVLNDGKPLGDVSIEIHRGLVGALGRACRAYMAKRRHDMNELQLAEKRQKEKALIQTDVK